MITRKADPLELFAEWYGEAAKSEPNDPTALSLATVGADGTPSVRMVLLKDFDARGFVFYTNYQSRKGEQLLAHPKAAMASRNWSERAQSLAVRAARRSSTRRCTSGRSGLSPASWAGS